MSLYRKLQNISSKFVSVDKLIKAGFNWSPMYRRSTAKLTYVSKDLMHIKIKLPINYKNRNYMNSIFGGSMFSAVDPIPMIQLVNLLGDNYVVWDKSAEIQFKRPAKENLYADFKFTREEITNIKQRVTIEKEIEIVKVTQLMNHSMDKVFCEISKRVYIADKEFYKSKRKQKQSFKQDSI